MGRTRVISALICLIVVFSLVLTPLASADWTMFRSNLSHNGAGTGNPPLTPTLLWKYTPKELSTSFESSPAVVNGVVYIGSYGNFIYALNAYTGVELWGDGLSGIISSPAVAYGIVYVGSRLPPAFYAVSAGSGKLIGGILPDSFPVVSSPTVANGVVYLDYGALYAINANAHNWQLGGSINWANPRGGYSSPAVVNGVVYTGSIYTLPTRGIIPTRGNVYAINATNGNILWNYTTGATVGSSPAVVDGIVYVSSNDGSVYALNANNGTKLWNYTINSAVNNTIVSTSSPAVVNGVVYVGSTNESVYALNAANGKKIWSYTADAPETQPIEVPLFVSSPAVVGDVVYIGLGDNIYALNATSGVELWNYVTGGLIESSPSVVNGVLYVGSDDGSVYAIGSPSPTPSPASGNSGQWLEIAIIGSVMVIVVVLSIVVILRKKTLRKSLQKKV